MIYLQKIRRELLALWLAFVIGGALIVLAWILAGTSLKVWALSVGMGIQLIGAGAVALILENRLPGLRVSEIERLPVRNLVKRIERQAKQVWILDIWMSAFVADGRTWGELKDALAAAVSRGAMIQILVVDPLSDAAIQRADELADGNKEEILAEMKNCAEELQRFHHQLELKAPLGENTHKHFAVKVHRKRPDVAVHRIDSDAYWCFFPRGDVSSDRQQMCVKWDGEIGEYLEQLFQALWCEAEDIAEWDPRVQH